MERRSEQGLSAERLALVLVYARALTGVATWRWIDQLEVEATVVFR